MSQHFDDIHNLEQAARILRAPEEELNAEDIVRKRDLIKPRLETERHTIFNSIVTPHDRTNFILQEAMVDNVM
jgi:hypothetical protein